jgi:hypothetical protein
MRSKQEYTDIFLKNIEHTRVPKGSEMVFFWQNVRVDGGLRLSQNGYDCLVEDLGLETYEIPLWDDKGTVRLNYKFFLDLEKYLQVPYYLAIQRWPRIILFDEKTYFWSRMHKDFQQFLDNNKTSDP